MYHIYIQTDNGIKQYVSMVVSFLVNGQFSFYDHYMTDDISFAEVFHEERKDAFLEFIDDLHYKAEEIVL